MTQGQRLGFLAAETEKAHRNHDKIAKPWKYAGLGTGAALGGVLGKVASGKGAAATAAVAGGLLGYEAGSVLGSRRAKKKGHDPEKRSERLARRLDRIARKQGEPDIYENEAYKNRMLRKISGDTGQIRDEVLLGGLG
jgi:uncharacterized protein YcfJ